MAKKGIQPAERPTARDQRRRSRGLLITAGLLFVLLVAGVSGMAVLVMGNHAQADGSQGQDTPTLSDPEAPSEPEPAPAPEPADDRQADLQLDPSKQTDWHYKTDGTKTVYLTFDDGPSQNTQKVLDILDQYGAKATFFVTGHEPQYRSSIKDAYDRGNTIGMHTFTHDYATVYASEDAYFNDLDQVAQVVKDQIGYVPFLVRFPGGASNTVSANYSQGIMTKLSEDVPARGYQFYDWNVSSGDAAGNNIPVDTIVSSSCVEGYTNIMLLFHDSGAKGTTVEALPQILQFYKDRGYSFKAITRESFVCHHKVNN